MRPTTLSTVATLAILCGGCATVDLPEVPEYHPASPHAPQALRIEAFDVLTPVPAPPPELPVPEGPQLAPQDPEMKMKDGKKGDGKMGHKMGVGEMSHEHGHVREDAPPADPELHGPAASEGMMEGMPAGPQPQYLQDHLPPRDTLYRERIEDDIERGEAQMDPIKIPTEQRGMNADSPLYHEHKHHDSTHITHPDRFKDDVDTAGRRVWACPRHPQVMLETPGGQCPECGTILVPVRGDR